MTGIDHSRGSGPGLLAVLVWIAVFALVAWLVHAALFFFPEGWRWTNQGGVRSTWTVRQAIAVTLALPLSLWVVAHWPRSREEELEAAAAEEAPARGGQGCGTLLLVLAASALLLRPLVLVLFPAVGLDPDAGGPLPFLLWLVVCGVAISVAGALARRRG